jgi:hypothetical protein
MLNDIMLGVIMLSVVAPRKLTKNVLTAFMIILNWYNNENKKLVRGWLSINPVACIINVLRS